MENSVTNRMNQLLSEESYLEFQRDFKHYASWMYAEPINMDFNDRFELDKEAYIKTYHEGVHNYKAPYNETLLIKKLIKNLEKAEHPNNQDYVIYLNKKLKNPKPEPKPKPQTLLDIWDSSPDGKKAYHEIIERLKDENSYELNCSFVNENGNWNTSIVGRNQYMAGFVYLMTKKNWIKNWYSAPQYKKILEKTFGVKVSPEPFKSLQSGKIDAKYIEPFKNLAANLK